MDKDYKEKIRKLLALEESPNEHEARAALLKARQLMAEHKLTEAELKDVDKDCVKDGGTMHPEGCVACGGKCSHKYCDKFKWVIDRAKAYGEATGLNWEDVLDGWETDRNYWYMNYYQDCNQPEIKAGKVRVFGTILELKEAIGEMKFRCPSCGKESPNPYECKACGWKVYGLLGDMGKGVFVYVKEQLRGETMFMPISWEEDKV